MSDEPMGSPNFDARGSNAAEPDSTTANTFSATPKTPPPAPLRGRKPRFRRGGDPVAESPATTSLLDTDFDSVAEAAGEDDYNSFGISAARVKEATLAEEVPDLTVAPKPPQRAMVEQVKSVVQAVLGTTESSKRNPPLEALVGIGFLVIGLLVVGLVSMRPQAPQTVMPGADVRLVCPGFTSYPGVISGQVQGNGLQYSTIGSTEEPTLLQGQLEIPGPGTPAFLDATEGSSGLIARLDIQTGAQNAAANCGTPLASQYLLFPSVTGSVLQLANPDQTDAVFNITIVGPEGEVTAEGLRDARLLPGEVYEFSLSEYVGVEGPVGVRVQNTFGRLQAAGLVTHEGLDIIGPSRTGMSLVAPGVPLLAGVQVVVTNPATVRVNVSVSVMTNTGLSELAGASSVIVEASQTKVINLTEAIMGRSGAVMVTANNDVAASVVVSYGDDLTVIPAVPTTHLVAEPLMAVAQASTAIVLANADEEAVSVPVALYGDEWETMIPVEVPAGGSTRYQIPPGTLRVGIDAPDLVASVLVSDQGGFVATGLPLEVRDTGRTPLRVVIYQK